MSAKLLMILFAASSWSLCLANIIMPSVLLLLTNVNFPTMATFLSVGDNLYVRGVSFT
jgi:hypothetical protein